MNTTTSKVRAWRRSHGTTSGAYGPCICIHSRCSGERAHARRVAQTRVEPPEQVVIAAHGDPGRGTPTTPLALDQPRGKRVRPVDVRLRAGREHGDPVVPLDQPLGERAGVLLGAAGDLLAVALHDVEDAHQTTSPIASSIATLASISVSSCEAAAAAADQVVAQVRVVDDAVDRLGDELGAGPGREQQARRRRPSREWPRTRGRPPARRTRAPRAAARRIPRAR